MEPDLELHEWIKFSLRRKGSSLAQVSNELNVGQGTVTAVCQGRRRSRRVESTIAKALGLAVEELFLRDIRLKSGGKIHDLK